MATPLPPTSDLVTTGISKGVFKAALTSLRAYLAGLLGTTGEPIDARKALGTGWHSSVSKTGAYTVVATDRGKVIMCSGTWTLSLAAVATLGDGFVVEIANTGTGVITIDPNLSEQIDGASTLALAARMSLVVYCDGVKLVTFGRGGVGTFNTRSGAVTLTSTDISNAGGSVSGHTHSEYVSKDVGAVGVGCFATAVTFTAGFTVASGGTAAGSSLEIMGSRGVGGTWRNVSPTSIGQNSGGMVQRIA